MFIILGILILIAITIGLFYYSSRTKNENIIGLTPKEAERSTSMIIRPIKIDGEDLMVTMDYRTDRINVEVQNGIIIRIVSIG